MDLIKKLTKADYISFIGLFFAWISILLIEVNIPKFAIITSLIAFMLDILDGWTSRKFKTASLLGRQIDSYVDIFTYLIFSALLVFKFLSPNLIIGIIVGFFILLFGGLRLIRFNNEGILSDKGATYYRGVTVVHIYLLVLVLYFINKYSNLQLSWVSTVMLLVICPSMLSNFKSYKIKNLLYLISIIIFFLLLTIIS
ncbi:hypothetical protein A2W14_03030 [Candidatus Gottesmanbacteria bacterium RBG_16_37_8]|uniref:CDP-alcohol phosphatidyltransferase n=1 Tax=Candidatus Gottesmanbacteria bacterium RBG_16_37_8 TaxID=1798371 RepID=A0A1F5YTY2_9BACT|nr:MAG: hypothetical protein A2W14_03030 [Candidatus Gottesmanbacteria bacterium RBG_16_37_8]